MRWHPLFALVAVPILELTLEALDKGEAPKLVGAKKEGETPAVVPACASPINRRKRNSARPMPP